MNFYEDSIGFRWVTSSEVQKTTISSFFFQKYELYDQKSSKELSFRNGSMEKEPKTSKKFFSGLIKIGIRKKWQTVWRSALGMKLLQMKRNIFCKGIDCQWSALSDAASQMTSSEFVGMENTFKFQVLSIHSKVLLWLFIAIDYRFIRRAQEVLTRKLERLLQVTAFHKLPYFIWSMGPKSFSCQKTF